MRGLYLHIPFCSRICPYCDFSVLTGGEAARRGFVASLRREIELWADHGSPFDQPFDTVYFGGGTPSALAPEELGSILESLGHHLEIAPDAGLFLEANPEDVTVEALGSWRRLGFTTLSLGVQSFDPQDLAFLGRRHTPEQARQAVELALGAGFATVSLDLIFGLPGQSEAGWSRQLDTAAALGTQHLSCYQLTFHEGTPFGFRRDRGELDEMAEDDQARFFHRAHQRLAAAGLAAYEVSNFARAPEHRSRHNQKYWHHVPYLGLGPSAHSFDGKKRWWNVRKMKGWQAQLAQGEKPIEDSETLTPQQTALEMLMLGLRTVEGVDLERVHRRTGIDLAARNAERLVVLEREGLLRQEGERLVPTLRGLAVADGLVAGLRVET
jgi:putative oxygen-independent coproporphyrinogen III oxidase